MIGYIHYWILDIKYLLFNQFSVFYKNGFLFLNP